MARFKQYLVFLDRYADLRGDRAAEILTQMGGAVAFLSAIPFLHPSRTPYTLELLAAALRLANFTEMRFKHALAGRRPNEYSPQVQPIILTPSHSSLPERPRDGSVHRRPTCCGSWWGIRKSALRRRRAGVVQLMRLASRVAINRTVAGVHFPVDSAAGCFLGLALGEYFVAPLHRWCGDDLRAYGSMVRFPRGGGDICRRTTAISTGRRSLRRCSRRRRRNAPYVARAAAQGVLPSPILRWLWDKATARVGLKSRLRHRRPLPLLPRRGLQWHEGAKYTSAWDTINPYVNWALGSGTKQYFIPGATGAGPGADAASPATERRQRAGLPRRGLHRERGAAQALAGLVRGPVPHAEPADGKPAVWASTMATEGIVEANRVARARALLDGVSLGRPLDTQALPAARETKAESRRAARRGATVALGAPADPPAVVMGVIDDGIAFAHERFRKIVGGGDRIAGRAIGGCRTGPAAAAVPLHARVQPDVPYGCELYKSQTDRQSASQFHDRRRHRRGPRLPQGPSDRLSKSARRCGCHHQSAAWRAAHGTHVMDLACGFDPSPPVHNRPIVCVQLPTRVTADERPGDLNSYICKDGITHIVERAQALAPSCGVASLPVVINVSYGLTGGPARRHGRSRSLHRGQDRGMQGKGLRPSRGPAFRQQLPLAHPWPGLIRFGGTDGRCDWRVLPDDRTASVLEIWLPRVRAQPSRVTLKITSPNGASMTLLELGTMAKLGTPAGDYAWAYWALHSPSDRSWFMVVVQSTAHRDPATPVAQLAPAGIWKVELTHTGGLVAALRDVVHAWIRRDDQVYGFPLRGRQSYLDHADYTRFDHAGRDEQADDPASLVRRESTINSMATGGTAIVMGGYLGKERLPAKYSAAGAVPLQMPPPPPPDLTPRWPDAMAVSEDSRVHAGVLAAGSYSGSVIAMGGTSVAAPQIARMVADNLAIGGAGIEPWFETWRRRC